MPAEPEPNTEAEKAVMAGSSPLTSPPRPFPTRSRTSTPAAKRGPGQMANIIEITFPGGAAVTPGPPPAAAAGL